MKILLMIFIITGTVVNAIQSPNKDSAKIKKTNVEAVRTNDPIEIDGRLNEPAWQNAKPVSAFIQRDPVEGVDPTEKTVIYVIYDNEALYVGARMYDASPDSIVARLARRDNEAGSDFLAIFLDPYYDRRSGYYFGINAAGILLDGVLYNNDWDDSSWDGVWEGKTNIDGDGWTAEMRIPFSQLRFNEHVEKIWGINFRRDISRKNERNYLVYVPKNESGFVSHFADLYGINGINPPGKIEILPYITGRAEFIKPDGNDPNLNKINPFNDGSKYLPGIGADLKMGLGSSLTLNAAINPDFGQVEIDPAVLNLSDVETFFSEKRPFFVEGSTIFNFGQGGARNYWGFNWSGPRFFYSRRIGRMPQGSVLENYDYKDSPDGTSILGAAKITGKVSDVNVGVIQAITQREFADISINKQLSEVEVEPFSYYGVFRAQKEMQEGHYGLGLISTVAQRDFKNDGLRNQINNGAYTGGIDGWIFLDSSKTWVFAGWLGGSHVSGTKERITSLQQNSQHYFQRPDASHVDVDTNATSLTGYAARFVLNRQKGNFFFNSAFGLISPAFDVNDLGFQFRSDQINGHAGAGYYWSDPTDFYRSMEVGGAYFGNSDFGGNLTGHGLYHFGYLQFLNYYSVNWNFGWSFEVLNNRRTRGGPLTIEPGGYNGSVWVNSDSRKDLIFGTGGFGSSDGYYYNYGIEFSAEYRPMANLSISLSPVYSFTHENAQYVGTFSDPAAVNTFGNRYVFGTMEQSTVSAGIRLNWTFSPTLSLQTYIQPLISAADFIDYKELKEPGSYDFLTYGDGNSTIEYKEDEGKYIVDPDGAGPASQLSFGNRDFNFVSLRGNAVLRWEYMPGSTLFFVWTQSRSDFDNTGDFKFGRSVDKVVTKNPDNIFMIKLNYWLNM